MIIEVPVCGPQAHLCPLYGAGVQCLAGYSDLLCAQTRSCWGNSQRRGCPALLSCALEHMRQLSACCFGGIQGESHMARVCSRVGVRAGWGISWGSGLVLVGAVCGGDEDSKWYTSGPVHGFEWRRKHYAADRRAKQANKQDFQGLVAVTTATPGPVLTGKGARSKRLGKQARERLRRQKAKKRDQSSIRRPERAQAGGPRDQVEQKMSRQEQAPAIIAAADDDLAAPSSRSRTSAGDGRKNQEEFCARLSMNQRIVITNPEFDGKNLEGGRTPKKRGASKSSGPPIKQAGGSRGEGREREEKRADAMNVVSSIINILIDNTYDCAVVVAQRKQADQPGGKIASGSEGKGESPEGSSGDTDSESSEEETASSSGDDSIRAVGTVSSEGENWKLQETVEDGFTRVSTREEKRQAKREAQKEEEKKITTTSSSSTTTTTLPPPPPPQGQEEKVQVAVTADTACCRR